MQWISDSPFILLLAVAFTAFMESFALLGLLIPGVVILFSLAAIAQASGISAFTLMLAGAGGALVGDIGSFLLGHRLQHRVEHWSWFQRHQSWLDHGHWFIARWGWLSVIIGRFLGPLRPVIPLVAGTLKMPARVFIPLSLFTVTLWAPAYLLPGYYTGELTQLWQLQPLGTRSLIILALSALAIAGGSLAIYHHTHPDQLVLRGWLKPAQAKQWPIHALSVIVICLTALFALQLFTPVVEDAEYARWALEWTRMPINEIWLHVLALSSNWLLSATLLTLALWLIMAGRWRLMLLLSVTTAILIVSADWVAHWQTDTDNSGIFARLTVFCFSVGMLALVASNYWVSSRRWPIYLMASQLMIVMLIAHLWEGSLSLSGCGSALFLALLFNGVLRAIWHIAGPDEPLPSVHALLLLTLIHALAIFAVHSSYY